MESLALTAVLIFLVNHHSASEDSELCKDKQKKR